MGKTWVLDTETKGTGANMVPLEKTLAKPAPKPPRRPAPRRSAAPAKPAARPAQPREVKATPLPPGHVRKKDTGEIGRVEAVDPKAGTARVFWLKRGSASTVPLSRVSRR